MKRFLLQWAGAAMLAIAAPAHAYFDHFLSGTIVGTLGKDQTAELASTLGKTMNDSGDGVTVPFRLAPNAKGEVTEGSITPLMTRMESGQRCRQVRTELRQAGRQTERWTGWYCQQQDGDWKRVMLKD